GTIGLNSVLNISTITANNKVLARMRNGLVYSIENGTPLLYNNTIKDTSYYAGFDGHFPSLSIFNTFNLPVAILSGRYQWNAKAVAILPIGKNDFIVPAANDSLLFYYKNGV